MENAHYTTVDTKIMWSWSPIKFKYVPNLEEGQRITVSIYC